MADLETYKMNTISGTQFEGAISLHRNSIAEQFSSEKSYVVGDYVMYDGLLYMCTTATTGAWDASKWEQHKIFDNDVVVIQGGNA